jgi:hypothetical protein
MATTKTSDQRTGLMRGSFGEIFPQFDVNRFWGRRKGKSEFV